MKADDQVGIFIGNNWRFWVNSAGQGLFHGALIQTSDRRLKRDFKTLDNSLTKISNAKGYNDYLKILRRTSRCKPG
ncbi:tail fiber domain-containing protein [Dyadobacter sp. CY323]|uniref:tail fiber domain-containing protein n=1 Tax=Dyadobacter sp. CY323 TaxID=2907302 RepID=UPI001F444525|nr:tail fiber domain-containing protein [Dyadobacter sp. CY323]MCE6987766.1 tail fiber domain-containing protein [Dyadobacter sp. CY323]